MRPALVWCLLLAPTAVMGQMPAPSFAGRPLDAWVKDLADPNPLVREEALEVIARLGVQAKSAADAVRPLLKDPLATTRLRAALALWKIERKPEVVLPVLAEASRDDSRATRLLVLDVAQEIAPDAREIAPILVECLGETDQAIRSRALVALDRVGPAAVTALVAGLKHDNAEVVRQVLASLGRLGPRAAEAAPAVRERLKDKTPTVRIAAASTLWAIAKDSDSALPVLLELVKGNDAAVRMSAYQVLFLYQPMPKGAIPAIEAALEDRDPLTRVRAADALYELDGRTKTTLPVLLAGIKDQNNYTARFQARVTLGKMPSAAKEIIPALVEHARQSPQFSAAHADVGYVLGRMGEAALEPLEGLLKDPTPSLRNLAINALVDIGDKGPTVLARHLPKVDANDRRNILAALTRYRGKSDEVVKALVETFKDGDAAVAEASLSTLINMGPRAAAAAPAALEFLKDPKRPQHFRSRTAQLFVSIGPAAKPAVPGLVELLKDTKTEDWLRQSVVPALGGIGPGAMEAVPALVAMLRDTPPTLRLRVLTAIRDINPLHEAIVPGVLALLKDPQTAGNLPGYAVFLGQLGPDARAAVPTLIEKLKESRIPHQKQEIVNALGRIGPAAREAIPALKEQLGDREPAYQAAVATALARVGAKDKEIVLTLIEVVKARPGFHRTELFEVLDRLGPDAAPALKELLAQWRGTTVLDERIRLAEAIASIDAEATKELLPWAREQSSAPFAAGRLAFIIWRADPKSPDGLPRLVKMLHEPSPYVRGYAAQGLTRIGPAAREHADEVEKLLSPTLDPKLPADQRAAQEQSNAFQVLHAARALSRIDPKKASKAALALGELAKLDAPALLYYRQQAIESLAAMGPDAAPVLPALIEVYQNQGSGVRYQLLDAIRQIDPKALAKLASSQPGK